MWIHSKQSRQLALEHQELESFVAARTAELQKLTQRLLKVQDEERRRIARDLHDSTGQTLAALKMAFVFLQQSCKEDSTKLALVSQVEALADQALEEIRTMSYLLHPPLLDEVGFACAAEWYIEGFSKRSGINVKAEIANSRGTASPEHGDRFVPRAAGELDQCTSPLRSVGGEHPISAVKAKL